MAILKNSVIVAFWTAASRGLGFARDLLIANRLGAGTASDAFFIALQLPNLLRRLLGEGAFNVAFVPLFAKEKAKSTEAALAFANATFGWLVLVLAIMTLVGELAMPLIVGAMMPGWLDQPEKLAMTVGLGRITFPYLMLICLAAFIGAVCNTYGKFAAYAMAPALLNFSFLGMLGVLPLFGYDAATVAAWAVPVGGIMQLAFMVWAMRQLGIRLRLTWPTRHPSLKPLLIRMGPAAVGVGVLQLSIIIDNFVGSWIEAFPAISYLQYANRFYQFPLALIGIAVATVLLPHLAVLLGEGNRKEAARSFTDTLIGCLTMATGATVVLFLLAEELMGTLIQHGEMTAAAAQAVAWAMMAYVIGLPTYIMTKVTAPAFFASGDPMTPVKASGIALAVNFALNVLFVKGFQTMGMENVAHIGIAFSTAAGGMVNAWLQWHWLRGKGILDVDTRPVYAAMGRMVMVGTVTALVIIGAKLALPYNGDWILPLKLVWLVGVGGLAAAMFVVSVQMSGLVDVRGFLGQIKAARTAKIDPKLKAAMKGDE